MAVKKKTTESQEYAESIIDTVREPFNAPGRKQIPVWKNLSFRHITVLMAACSVFYYMDVIINYSGWVNLRSDIFYTVHDLHRAFFLIPVMYAAYAFRLRGALVTSAVSFLIFLPRALFVSPYPNPLLRAVIFAVSMSIIGVFLSSLLESINKRKELEQSLSQAQNELLRKKAEEALRESEDKYKRLIDNIPDIIFTIDLEGKITFVSKRTKEILGYENAETINMNIFNFIPEEDRQRAMENLQKGMKGEKIRHFQIPLIAKSGEMLIFECSFARVYKDGKVVGAQGTAVDITERKRAEGELQTLLNNVLQEKNNLAALINGIADEVWFADKNKIFTLANPSAIKEFNLSSDATIDVEKFAQSLEVYRPDSSPRPVDEAPPLRALTGEVIKNQEEIVRTPATGELRYRQVSSTPIKDPAGMIIGSVSVVRDITEQKKAEAGVKKLYLRQQTLLDAIPDIIMEVDTNKIYTWANEPGLEFFGKDVIGKSADLYFVREQNTYDIVQPLFKGSDEVIYLESWQRRKDGQERLLAWWCRVLKDFQGDVIGALSSARDITEIRQTEGEIKKLNEELEQRVTERTAEIKAKTDELERINKVFVDRELRMRELKERIAELEKK